MRMHAADVGGDDLVMAADADLVVLAAPVQTNIDPVEQLADYIPGDAIVTDVGSTKRDIVTASRPLPPRLHSSAGIRSPGRRPAGSRRHALICSRAGPGF